MFSKRSETSGIRGHLYETKLISLLYFRAFHDDTIEEFQIASNVDKIGIFDDICFTAKVKRFDKPVAVFIQAKHKENEEQTLQNDLSVYFDSYLKIRQKFDQSDNDSFFSGKFDETECLFVIYTTAKDDFDNKSDESGFFLNLYDLIDTEGTAKKPYGQEEDVEFLCEKVIKEQVTALAEQIAKFIYEERTFHMMLSDDLIKCYHVILAQKVVDVSEIQTQQGTDGPKHRIASFRNDFFDNNEDYIVLFKDRLYKEVIKRRKIKPADVRFFLSEFLGDPTDERLSKLIGTCITYNTQTGQLHFDQKSTKVFRPNIKPIDVSQSTVNKAIELAAREILSSRQFKVPAAFGNKDLTISDRRIDYVASKMVTILKNCKSSKMVTIDESIEYGLRQLNGGIAGAVGNIFVLDDDTKLMKITDNLESLGNLSQKLYQKLSDEIHDLLEYKFRVKINQFPKLLFNCNELERSLARDFLNKLLFFSGQADETGVERILKNDIEDCQREHPNYLQAKTDAIFLEYHNKIREWWMRTNKQYLTRKSNLFQQSINNIIKEPLMNSINMNYMSKLKNNIYSFNNDAVTSLNLKDQHSKTIIIAENCRLTVMKVLQALRTKQLFVLDIEYIINLPRNDRNALREELANTYNILIFVCDKIRNLKNEKKILENIAAIVQEKKTIIITRNMLLSIITECFPNVKHIVSDDRSSLVAMTDESQKIILENATMLFQGKEIKLNTILDNKSMAYIKGDVLNKIINDETIVVGKLIINKTYDEIKHLYIDRRVKKMGDEDGTIVKNLNNIQDDIVLVTAEPGMGKTTLLTHLSIKTKECNPEIWIVRINLLEYSLQFSTWQKEKTKIDTLEALKFMCQIILSDKGKNCKVEIALEESNGAVYLKNCTGDQRTDLELNLFLHTYNKGMVIFLFDGFDEICPHYAEEVIKCINTVSNKCRKQRKWITSRSYNQVQTILQQEFGSSYEIDYFSYKEMEKYLEIFWDYHLRLEEFNSEQLKNVKTFIEYMIDSEDLKLHNFVMPLHQVYLNAVYYLINEIKYKQIPLWTYAKRFDDSRFSKEKDDNLIFTFHDDNSRGNPLHLYLTAVFFEDNIKSVHVNTDKWDLEVNAFAFYKRFMEIKMKNIRFQEKNELNLTKPDILMTYDKELTDFIKEHKKLAAFAIFKHWESNLLFSRKDLEEIKKRIRSIERGGEKTGLIYRVVDGIPIFIHMTFAEYFAVEYVCDCLKTENDNVKLTLWMDFIFNKMFSMDNLFYILHIFDYRMTIDKTLMSILENNKKEIFNLIMVQGRVYSEVATSKRLQSYQICMKEKDYWALSGVLQQRLRNFELFFMSILESFLNHTNLNDFLDIVKGSQLLTTTENISEDFVTFVVDIVRKIDESKLTVMLRDNFVSLSDSTICRCVDLSSQEIAQLVLSQEEPSDYQIPSQLSTSPPLPDNPPACYNDSYFDFVYGLSDRIYASSLPGSTSSLQKTLSTRSLPTPNLESSPFRCLSTFSLPLRLSASSLPDQTSNLPS